MREQAARACAGILFERWVIGVSTLVSLEQSRVSGAHTGWVDGGIVDETTSMSSSSRSITGAIPAGSPPLAWIVEVTTPQTTISSSSSPDGGFRELSLLRRSLKEAGAGRTRGEAC
jgi:hypothetical protein